MSHFDDIDFIFYGDSPKGCLAGGLFLVVAVVAIVWAVTADDASAKKCQEHGEKYIDSRSSYTLCEQDGGTVIRR